MKLGLSHGDPLCQSDWTSRGLWARAPQVLYILSTELWSSAWWSGNLSTIPWVASLVSLCFLKPGLSVGIPDLGAQPLTQVSGFSHVLSSSGGPFPSHRVAEPQVYSYRVLGPGGRGVLGTLVLQAHVF